MRPELHPSRLALQIRSKLRICLLLLLALTGFATAMRAQDTLRVVRPNGGEIFYTNRDTTIRIDWVGVDDTTAIQVDLSSNGGLSWRVIADSARGNTLDLPIEGLPFASGYLVRVQQLRPPGVADNIVYRQHRGPVVDGVWAPGDGAVATVAASGRIWGPNTDTTQHSLPGIGAGRSVDWSSDSLHVIVGTTDSNLIIYRANATVVDTIKLSSPIREARFNAAGTLIAIISDDNRLRIFSVATRALVASATHPQTINRVQWNPVGTAVATACDDGIVRVVNPQGGLPLQLRGHDLSGVTDLQWSRDGTRIATVGGDASTRIFNSVTGAQIHRYNEQTEGIRSVAWSPLDTLVAIGLSGSGVVLFDPVTGVVRQRLSNLHTRAVRDVDFSSTGTHLATASDDAFAIVVELETGNRTLLQHQSGVNRCVWSADATRLLTTSNDGTARIWRISNIVLQSDTSDATFSIAPPPPASLVIRTTGGTVAIGDTLQVRLLLEQTRNLALADIDSIRVTLSTNWTVLDIISSGEIASSTRSGSEQTLVLAAQAMPTADAILGVFSMRATLGADSNTAIAVTNVQLIGAGRTVSVATVSEPVVITGFCRAADSVRLYIPAAAAAITVQSLAPGHIHGSLMPLERGQHTLRVFSLTGRLLGASILFAEKPNEEVPWSVDIQNASGVVFVVCEGPSVTQVVKAVQQ